MKKVTIVSGICGFSTTVAARMDGKDTVLVEAVSSCDAITAMFADLKSVDKMSMFATFFDNPVYIAANKHLQHLSCPVPSGTLKAIEAEAGFSIPKNATITFVEE